MEINRSANHSYPPPKKFGLLPIITFLILVCQINSATQPNTVPNFGDDSNIFEAYRNATAEKREASSDILKIKALLEFVKLKIQSFGDEELLTINDISHLTTQLAHANSRAARKRTKKELLSAEKKLLDVMLKVRMHKERLMDVNDQLENEKKRLEAAQVEINKIKS